MKKELHILQKSHKEELEKLFKEREEFSNDLDKRKFEEIRNLEKTYKLTIEKIKLKSNETEEKNDILN